MKWINMQYPKAMAFHIPNGGKMNVATGARLKRMGVRRGVPDICVPCAHYEYRGLYIELKAEGKKPTPEQRKVLEHLEQQGYFVAVCDSFDKFKACVDWYMRGVHIG